MNPYNYPWYDSRATTTDNIPPPNAFTPSKQLYTPKEIYNYLDERIKGQEEAKKAVSMLMHKTLNGIKQNLMLCGPSGSGKSEIWRQLQKIFPNHISIVDGSNITCDGWKGDKKWINLLESPIFRQAYHTICVIDEADKMISPKFNGNRENVSYSIMSEGLKIIEGTDVILKTNNARYRIDTHNISFVFLGAFSPQADDIAERNQTGSMGFASSPSHVNPYDNPLTIQDIIDFGATPEFMGRIQKIVNLTPITEEDFSQMLLEDKFGPIQKIEEQYKIKLNISLEKCRELSKLAFETGLGVRAIESALINLVDDALFENYQQHTLSF